LQSGGVLALAILALGLTTPDTVWHELESNLEVLTLLIFMVSFIYFMKPLLSLVFAKLIINVRSKWLLSLIFSATAALMSAFLDALTVMAVLIAVFSSLYTVYEKIHSSQNTDYDRDQIPDSEELGGDILEEFRDFIRSLMMHGAVGTALGGTATMVGEPQNLLIAEKLDWSFVQFAVEMSRVSVPALIAGFATCMALEWARVFGYGAKMDDTVRAILTGYMRKEDENRSPRENYTLWIQGISGVLLILGLAFHVMEVGLIGLSLLVLVTALTGINEEHRIGRAFEESLPFVSLLCIFFVVVGMIHDLHLFNPVIHWVLEMPESSQPTVFFLANGLLSAISDNVFVATVYINEVQAAFDAGEISREHFERLAVSINTGTNLPSVATPNGQAAFLFLLTSTLAPLIRLGYIRMVQMAAPYAVVLTAVGYLCQ
jgi:NhaB family Na+:H+ antiporter